MTETNERAEGSLTAWISCLVMEWTGIYMDAMILVTVSSKMLKVDLEDLMPFHKIFGLVYVIEIMLGTCWPSDELVESVGRMEARKQHFKEKVTRGLCAILVMVCYLTL